MDGKKDFITQYLITYYDEVSPKEFYRFIFPCGALETKGEQTTGKYNAIALELLPAEKDTQNVKRYVITDDLDIIDELVKSDNFIIVSPISYIGRSRISKNARFFYGLAIDLDGIETEQNLTDLFYQIDNEVIPKPTFIVSSGFGIHLYYIFDKAIPCFNNINTQLANYKRALTKRLWNKYITSEYDKPQFQSIFQGFRMVGTITKSGGRTRAFQIGNRVNIEYLNNFVDEEYRIKDYTYKSDLTKKEAAKLYPEWYQKRIINNQPKGTWICKRDLYDWWLGKLKSEIAEGHRYFGIMCLSIYAKKSGISREELEKDAFGLLDEMEKLTTDESNHFTREDILAALELYNDNYMTFPIDTISSITNIKIEKNKRNGRKQAEHIKLMNFIRDEINKNPHWQNKNGRPTKELDIVNWRKENPTGTKAECIRQTGISKPTVYKYWDYEKER